VDYEEQRLAKALTQARAQGDKEAELSAGIALMAKSRMRIRARVESLYAAVSNDNR
jgi:hypothetical protein